MKYLMGIDNGGTFCKAAIFDENGKQIAVASSPTVTITPKPGYTERDMVELWESNAKAIRDCIRKSNIDCSDLAGVSFSGHGKGLYLVDKDGSPAYNGIISTDNRAWEVVKNWYEDGTSLKVYKKTFQEILASQPVSLLAWFKKYKPEVLEKTKYIFHIKDYIRFCLTGEAYAEYTDSTGSNLINLTTGTYDDELLSYFGLEDLRDKLPELKYSAEICGYVTHEAADFTGLPEGIPVAAGMFDINACGIASGLCDEDKMCMIAGTWSINEFLSRKPITNGTVALNSMYCIPGYYLVEESSPTSAGNMEWFIRNLMDKEEEYYQRPIYDIANEWVDSTAPDESNVIFLPFLNGSNTDPLAKGTFVGLTAYHNKKHMLRAVYEGVVFSHLTHVKKLLKNHEVPESIRLAGGVTKSEVWVQMFADIFQISIDVIEDKEIGAHGAAIAAGIASGLYKDYKDAIEKTVKITKQIKPRSDYRKIYEEKYETYCQIIEGLSTCWQQFKN